MHRFFFIIKKITKYFYKLFWVAYKNTSCYLCLGAYVDMVPDRIGPRQL